jgi:hypothetical protein
MNGLTGKSSMVMVGTIALSLLMRRVALLEQGLWLLRRTCSSCLSFLYRMLFFFYKDQNIVLPTDWSLSFISIHNLSIIRHIEDVSIAKDHQGKLSMQAASRRY